MLPRWTGLEYPAGSVLYANRSHFASFLGLPIDFIRPARWEIRHLKNAARRSGLRYVTVSSPGIRRRRRGRGFSYVSASGRAIRDPAELARIRALAIPPNWRDVWICPDPLGHIQATGRDSKGRKQYRYHPLYREIRDQTKFDRMLVFSEVLPKIRDRVENDLSLPGLPREKVLATVVRLLEKTLIRVGNQAYAKENRSFGLTTLRDGHVEIEGSELRFEFRGKSGVKRRVAITDTRLAGIVQQCQTLPGQELFQYVDDSGKRRDVDSGDINDYLRNITGLDVTAKDFRTWAGTMYAATALRELGPASSEQTASRNIVKAVDLVADKLGNTRAVCRKYYIHPGVVEAYREGEVVDRPPPLEPKRRERATAALRRDELEVLKFLRLRTEG